MLLIIKANNHNILSHHTAEIKNIVVTIKATTVDNIKDSNITAITVDSNITATTEDIMVTLKAITVDSNITATTEDIMVTLKAITVDANITATTEDIMVTLKAITVDSSITITMVDSNITGITTVVNIVAINKTITMVRFTQTIPTVVNIVNNNILRLISHGMSQNTAKGETNSSKSIWPLRAGFLKLMQRVEVFLFCVRLCVNDPCTRLFCDDQISEKLDSTNGPL